MGLFVVGLSLAACPGPHISGFRIEPRESCPGSRARLTWSFAGDGSLSSTPPSPVDQLRLAPSGETAVRPTQSTTYLLTVHRNGREAQARVDLSVTEPRDIGERTQPEGGALLAIATVPAENVSANARVSSIANSADRAIRVRHAGADVIVPAGSSAPGPDPAVPLSGEWQLRADLLPGERLGDPAHSPPTSLRVRVAYNCPDGPR